MDLNEMLDIISEHEGGNDWGAWNPNDAGHGISWGRWQFNQRGGLPALLRAMHEADSNLLDACFAPWVSPAYQVRLAEGDIRTMNLNSEAMQKGFRAASKEPVFQQCQRDQIILGYVLPARNTCIASKLTSWRWLALLADTSIQYGPGGMRRLLKLGSALAAEQGATTDRQIQAAFSQLADDGKYNRRARILVDERIPEADWIWPSKRPPKKAT